MFYSDPDIWQEAQARAFLRAVPLGKMIVLDLQSELYPQYQRLSSYYGQPFIWCMLHNYGGVTGLYASLDLVNTQTFEGRNYEGSTMIGTGLTPEGIGTNDIVYELMNEMAWRPTPTDLHEWLEDFARRRYGVDSARLQLALLYLRKSVYNATDPYRNHGKYILIRRPSLKLKTLRSTNDSVLSQSALFRHDLVDLTRQILQLSMDIMYPDVVKAFRSRNITALNQASKSILELYDDMEELLASDEHFLLGRWLKDALNLAHTPLVNLRFHVREANRDSWSCLKYSYKQSFLHPLLSVEFDKSQTETISLMLLDQFETCRHETPSDVSMLLNNSGSNVF
ncbi:alpha-N-acetylglucosaminidase [Caerostris extrusa]|uniref:Alpha-N-acetylglucosaminidase n=1 Tax=Caerostris extrusa TaxID=172846 RepID=A0AAV4TPI3_CAEEX|nr:alpha-N-acetylglucosaminidase [Caerostris extrusa]